MDSESLQLLEDGLRKTMTTASGQQLDAALAELGWLEMLDEMPDTAVPLVFRLLGETGAHAPVLNDVVLRAASREGGEPCRCHSRAAPGWCGSAPTSRAPRWATTYRYTVWPKAIRCRLPPDGMRSGGGWWAPAAQCCRWRVSMRWTAGSSAGPSRRFRRSGTGSPRPWSPSKARKHPGGRRGCAG